MTWQNILFISFGSIGSVSLFVYTVYTMIFATKIRTDNRLSHLRQMTVDNDAGQGDLKEETLPFSRRIVRASGAVSQKLKIGEKGRSKKQLKLLRSGIMMKPEELTGVTIISAFITGAIVLAASSNLLLSLLAMIPGYLFPEIVVIVKMKSRAKKLNDQLPDALSVIANGIRAGFSFNQAVSLVVKEMEAPISEEFGRMLRENAMGKPMDEALEALSARTGDEDLDIVITALLIQRQVGGSLAEILDTIADTIRERVKLKGDIRTMTAQGKMSAAIVSVMPVVMGIMMSAVSPGYMDPMFTTPMGRVMLIISGVMIGLGILVLSKIVKIKV